MEVRPLDYLNTSYEDLHTSIQNRTRDVDLKIIILRRYLENNAETLSQEFVRDKENYNVTYENIRRLGNYPAIAYQIGVIQQRAAILQLSSLLRERATDEQIADWISENENAFNANPQELDFDPVDFFYDLQQARDQLSASEALTPD